jgi:HK97 family phage portal protein
MSLVRAARAARDLGDTTSEMVPPRRSARVGAVTVDSTSALRQSAVWACLQLRSNMVSSMPLDVYRRTGGVQVEVQRPSLFDLPGGPDVGLPEWLAASQIDIDRAGNSVGIIVERDGNKLPKTVELQRLEDVSFQGDGPRITEYRVCGKTYKPADIWHERGFTIPGIPWGLSAIAYGAWSIGGYLSAQQFALDWFAMGPHPKGTLKNTVMPRLSREKINEAREVFTETAMSGKIFVTGSEWEYTPESQASAGAVFIEEMKYGSADICRFLGVPADMIDAGTGGSNITYANVTQKNLQFLTLHLQPAIMKREWYLSRHAVSNPRYVKFNTDAILRLDPQARVQLLLAQVAGRILAPSEAREIDNRAPFSASQLQEFVDLGFVTRTPDPKPMEAVK